MAEQTVATPTKSKKDSLPKLDDPSLYINRELSWLEFNRRVMEEGKDPTVPLLERVKFFAIYASNLDEFFMVRVGGLQHKFRNGITTGSGADRMPVVELLDRISQIVLDINDEVYQCLNEEILPALSDEGIHIRQKDDLTPADRSYLSDVFLREIFPVLTPLAIDPGHPFPHLLNKSINLAVVLQRSKQQERLFAVVQVPSVLPRFVSLPSEKGHVFVPLETVIRLHLSELFPGMDLLHDALFRVTRNSEYELDDDEVDDLLKAIEEEVRKRRRGVPVRLSLEATAADEIEKYLTQEFSLLPRDVYRAPGLLDLTGLFQIAGLPDYAHLHDPPFVPQPVPDFLNASNIWSAIRGNDILVHHPYESFNCVVEFIETAAQDERVLAIKQTLYRTSSDSPIVKALQRAADNGKQVTAVIELKARMDEERNILWARELEKSGVHVVYGVVRLKTHCKVALVVRREDDGIHRYVHMATGNYNPQTARIYTDLGYFSANPDICDDASALFNYLTGYSAMPKWKKLVVAPDQMQTFLQEKIQQEIEHQRNGKEGKVIAKINGLLEPAVVQSLYRASQEGVRIDLICRGICSLRPQLPGISETIRVISIVDRFLEHSRIYYFHNNGEPEVYIGSADLMDRNLLRRVEVIFPVDPPNLKDRLIHEILEISLADNTKACELLADGRYQPVVPKPDEPAIRCQEVFQQRAMQNAHPKGKTFPKMPAVNTVEKSKRNKKRKG